MATLRRIQAVSERYNLTSWASQWLCVILGAYFSMQLISPVVLAG